MSQDSNKLARELKFIEDSFREGIITKIEYETAKKRIEDKLFIVKKEEEEEARIEMQREAVNKPAKEDAQEKTSSSFYRDNLKSAETKERESKGDKGDNADNEMRKSGEDAITDKEEPKVEFYYGDDKESAEKEEALEERPSRPDRNRLSDIPKEPLKVAKPYHEPVKKKEGASRLETYGRRLNSPKKTNLIIIISVILLLIIVLFSIYGRKAPEERFIPVCVTSLDCYKQGYFGTCLNASTRDAKCIFEPAVPVNITIIDSEACVLCDVKRMQNTLLQLYPGASFKMLDINDTEGRKLMSDLGIKALPAYVFDMGVERTERFDSVKSTLLKIGKYYIMKPGAAGSSYFFNNKKKENSVELFLSPFSSSSMAAFENLLGLIERRDADFNIRLYTNKEIDSSNGEIYELMREVCIREHSRDKLVSYLSCVFEQGITETSSSSCEDKYNIPSGLIDTCINNQGKSLLNEDIKLADAFSINTAPVFVFNNQHKKGGSLSVDILDDAYCSVNPESC